MKKFLSYFYIFIFVCLLTVFSSFLASADTSLLVVVGICVLAAVVIVGFVIGIKTSKKKATAQSVEK